VSGQYPAAVILDGARTPMGKLMGALSGLSAAQLGAAAIRPALARSGVDPAAVGYVIMGQVLTAGTRQLPARQAAVAAGIPMDVPALTVSKVCLSGIQAVILAAQFVRGGELEFVVAGGQESMSQAPHLLPGSRSGYRYGPVTLLDHMAVDGLEDAYDDISIGLLTERRNDIEPVSRADQDEFAASSHCRAAAARDAGRFAAEVVPVTIPQRRGEPVVVARDEGIRPDSSAQTLAALPPAFRGDGTVTAGNASPISDGACAMVVASRERAEADGLPWLAELGAYAMVAGPGNYLQNQPANAIACACEREGIAPADLDLIEINEAFAAVGIASARKLGIGLDRVNVDGGAIAMGHPIGASGARITLHLAKELRRRGGGQGDALIVKVPGRA
jgi:acetyl-CoA C-acetyltransferase